MDLQDVREIKSQLLQLTTEGTAAGIRVAGLKSIRENPVQSASLALGVSKTKGHAGYRLAVRLFDQSDSTMSLLHTASLLASRELDAQYVGPLRAPRPAPRTGVFRKRHRPLRPGVSVGHHQITAGTLGAFVELPDGMVYMLSNNHVLANSNQGKQNDLILQPGNSDNGRPSRDEVGGLEAFYRMKRRGSVMDAAVAWVHESQDFELDFAGKLPGAPRKKSLDYDEYVWKVGRTTGVTEGTVTAIELDDVAVDYSAAGDGSVIYSFDSQIEIQGRGRASFSSGGDSGALILDEADRPVALLFAGSNDDKKTYANPLTPVLRHFEAKLLR